MNFEDLKGLIGRAREAGVAVHVVEGKGDSSADGAAEQLGLQFPESLKKFYGAYEYLQVGTQEFVWLKDLAVTLDGLRARHPGPPRHLLPVLADGFGGYYYVACVERGRAPSRGYGTVVYNPAGAAGEFETVSPDMLDFVASKVSGEIEKARED